jgi:hypothetical protein
MVVAQMGNWAITCSIGQPTFRHSQSNNYAYFPFDSAEPWAWPITLTSDRHIVG